MSKRLLATLLLLALCACGGPNATTTTEADVPADEAVDSRLELFVQNRLNPEVLALGEDWPDQLQGAHLSLPDGTSIDLARERSEVAPSGNATWIGVADGYRVTLTARGEDLVGLVTSPVGTLRVRSSGDGELVIQERLGEPLECDELRPEAIAARAEEIQPLTDEGYYLDVMQVYTSELAEYYFPGQSDADQLTGMELLCDNDVAWLNTAYSNSDVQITMRNVHVEEVDYTTSGSASTDLGRLTASGESSSATGSPALDGSLGGSSWRSGGPYLDDIHTLRDTYGADLVMLRVDDLDAGGVAWVTSANVAYKIYGFAVMANPEFTEITMAHEFGHNQGLSHDYATNGNQFATPAYAMGYRVVDQLATIMAYPSPLNYSLYLQYFSNPDLQVNVSGVGLVTLTDTSLTGDQRPDEHRRLEEMIDTVSNFRTHVEGYNPGAPTNLLASDATTSSISLTWTDNAVGEDSYELDRRPSTSTTWTTQSLPADSTSYTDTGLSDGIQYLYRVRAVIGSDASANSNQVHLRTYPLPPVSLAGTATSDTSIDLSWQIQSSNLTGHRVWRRLPPGAWQVIASLDASATGYSDSSLTPSSNYSYRVQSLAVNAYSSLVQVSNVRTGPAAPSNLTVTQLTPTSVRLTWADNSSDELSFRIKRTVGTGAPVAVHTAANVTSYDWTGLTTGTTYDFTCEARRGTVLSTATGPVSISLVP